MIITSLWKACYEKKKNCMGNLMKNKEERCSQWTSDPKIGAVKVNNI